MEEIKKLEGIEYVRLKGVLASEDGGKTWCIIRQDYVTKSEYREEDGVGHHEGRFIDGVNLEGIELRIKE